MTFEKEILKELQPRLVGNACAERMTQLEMLIIEERENDRRHAIAAAICERTSHVYVEMYQDGRDTPVRCTRCGDIEF